MSKLINWMKEVYTHVKDEGLEWKPIHPNNIPSNPVDGIYSDMFFEKDGKYQYVKYSIRYQARCDEECICHPDEGILYYIMYRLIIDDLDEKFEIPKPDEKFEKFDPFDVYADLVNDYGRFRVVFGDEETAKSAAAKDLLDMLYSYMYILSDEEIQEWKEFLRERGEIDHDE